MGKCVETLEENSENRPLSEISETEFRISQLPLIFRHLYRILRFATCVIYTHSKEIILLTIITSH